MVGPRGMGASHGRRRHSHEIMARGTRRSGSNAVAALRTIDTR
jgi:hypothetical protein